MDQQHPHALAMFLVRSHNGGMTNAAQKHVLGIGGRNTSKSGSGYVVSDYIKRRVTQSIFRATDYAIEAGTPMNQYVVINFRETSKASAVTIFADIRHRYRDWLYYIRKTRPDIVGAEPIYVYTLENPSDNPHANWTLHVPPQLQKEFERKLPRWIEKAQGACGTADCHIEPVNLSYAKVLAKYIVKGTEPEFTAHFFLEKYDREQGIIYGKRAGVSQAIGRAVRAEAGFRPRRSRYPSWTAHQSSSSSSIH
jgi:hypothetical protein